MASQTIRWYSPAGSRQVYAEALQALVIYARASKDDFTLGPGDLAALEHQGLIVTGTDLSGVRETLSKIPGLAEEEQ